MSNQQQVAVVEKLSREEFVDCLPEKMRKSVSDEVLNSVNQLLSNPDMHEQYRENLLSFGHVLREGKFKLTGYVDAIKYVSLKVCGLSNQKAFEITFPQKMKAWMARGVEPKDIASYVSSYNKSKLVNLILEQTLVPTHILNQDLYQRALNRQADLMIHAKSELVQTQAANSLLMQLKPPEVKKVELSVSNQENSAIKELQAATLALAAQQRQAIQAGQMNAQEVAHSRIIEGEVIEEVE